VDVVSSDIKGRLIDWWRRRRWSSPRLWKVEHFASNSGVPESIARRTLVVVGDPPVWAMFECPCGSGHRIMVRLKPHDQVTMWTLSGGPEAPTLWPSVDSVLPERRCHFWLRGGRVRWVADFDS